jgi:glycerol uptake operon antiterminator
MAIDRLLSCSALPKKQVSLRALRGMLEQSRIIPAIRKPEHMQAALQSPSRIIFIVCGTPVTIGQLIGEIRDGGKFPIANLDLLSGFGRDPSAVEFLMRAGVGGVISTHQGVLRAARAQGLISVLRTFAVDSVAIANCLRAIESSPPDIMELLPAIAAPLALIAVRHSWPDLPVIACGLVTSLIQVDDLVRQGITSISVSNPDLWIL